MENYDTVNKASDITLKVTVAFVVKQLSEAYGTDWWERGVLSKASTYQQEAIVRAKTNEERIGSIDFALCMALIDRNWREVFVKVLSKRCRTWAHELAEIRIDTAHRGVVDYSQSDTERALGTMSRLLAQMTEATQGTMADDMRRQREDVDAMLRKVKYGSAEGSRSADAAGSVVDTHASEGAHLAATPVSGLPNWREVMVPHQDVQRGEYVNAEFAADLAQVAGGTAAQEYQDPVEFFSRTYVTAGMHELLVRALERVSGSGGEPVIQLKTSFGGGKTHSMLALYHLLRSEGTALPNTADVLAAAGLSEAPRTSVAAVVGTALDPSTSRRPADFPGITINTMWGDIAAQLARAAGRDETERRQIYAIVQEADRKHVSPGSEAFRRLFDTCGPCLVLLDELVAYAKKLSDKDLPAGTFDNFITFIQEITEGARASKNSLVVASIPQSDNEIGGEAGQRALEAIEHTFGRMESIWKPVSASEGFEVVRRRLFLDCTSPERRDQVCVRFSEFYRSAPSGDFPVEAKDEEYRRRLIACYPIHPEFFDRLYEDWATLEKFQRTRSVLRLMAAIIHELWMANDPSPMIMPGSLPLDFPKVQGELTRYLPENWPGIIESEVDGDRSVPYKLDGENVRFGKTHVARRVARTIMLGSAPDVQGQATRGVDLMRLHLGCMFPGDNIALFNDALTHLRGKSSYLYSDVSMSRFWYDTRPTLRKTMEERASRFDNDDADAELARRVRGWRPLAPLAGLHACPASTLDVPDERAARLVVLSPSASHVARDSGGESPDEAAVSDILKARGQSPRKYRNMLVFLAADSSRLIEARTAAKTYLAWKSIQDDREQLNLDSIQTRQLQSSLTTADSDVSMRLCAAYSWLLVPTADLSAETPEVSWTSERLSVGDSPVEAAVRRLRDDELVIARWAPALLRRELDRVLWRGRDAVQVAQLWDMLCTYCYLPRLSDRSVLDDAIRAGLPSRELFAIAAGIGEGKDGSERYLDLRLGEGASLVGESDWLVRPEVAEAQLAAESPEAVVDGGDGTGTGDTSSANGGEDDEVAPVADVRRDPHVFTMTADLDTLRIKRDINQVVDEVLSHLEDAEGCEVSVTLKVSASTAKGFDVPTVRMVTENCRTLGINAEFRD